MLFVDKLTGALYTFKEAMEILKAEHDLDDETNSIASSYDEIFYLFNGRFNKHIEKQV